MQILSLKTKSAIKNVIGKLNHQRVFLNKALVYLQIPTIK